MLSETTAAAANESGLSTLDASTNRPAAAVRQAAAHGTRSRLQNRASGSILRSTSAITMLPMTTCDAYPMAKPSVPPSAVPIGTAIQVITVHSSATRANTPGRPIASSADVDYYVTTLGQGDRLRVRPGTDPGQRHYKPRVEIVDGSGAILLTSADGHEMSFYAPASGSYYVRVSSPSSYGTFTGSYGAEGGANLIAATVSVFSSNMSAWARNAASVAS